MGSRRAALRMELSHILGSDDSGSVGSIPEPNPPQEAISNRLHALITRGLEPGSDDARTVYEYLPLLMLRIFGFHPGSGWIETASELPHRDRDALLRIVLPNGPLCSFCIAHDPGADAKDFRYEFPVQNLPSITQRGLASSGLSHSGSLDSQSALAPFLRDAVDAADDDILLLSPMQYFILCMVASAANKWTPNSGVSAQTMRRQRRSASLPSVRALYNQVIFEYVSTLDVNAMLGVDSILIPACIDFYCMPWTEAMSVSTAPPASTQTVDSLASVMFALLPKITADFNNQLTTDPADDDWRLLRNGEAVFIATEIMLEPVFYHYNTPFPMSTLTAYVRLFALYIAPWKKSVKLTLHAALFPKPRPTAKRTSLTSLTSTWTSLNAHLKSNRGAPVGGGISSNNERLWREKLRGRRQRKELYLVLLLVICAANCRLGSSADGCRALALVAEAATLAKIREEVNGVDLYGVDTIRVRGEEAKGCLYALRDQCLEAEKRVNAKLRPFVGTLGSCLGFRIENSSLFSGVAEMVTGSNSPAQAVGDTRRHLHERRSSMMGNASKMDVPFLGSVWERPISRGENEKLVVFAYWLSLRLEPYLGFSPDTRFLGSYWVWISFLAIVLFTFFLSQLFQAVV